MSVISLLLETQCLLDLHVEADAGYPGFDPGLYGQPRFGGRFQLLNNEMLQNSAATCQYKPGATPYVRYKEEISSVSPKVSVFYDVISDNEAEYLMNRSRSDVSPVTLDTNYR